jgi:SAM-dependent methyltransferase
LRAARAAVWHLSPMKDYEPRLTFDATNAAVYDDLAVRGDEDATVEFLRVLAGDGNALELAIGTGRIALPLAASGVRVDGIDFSEPMVEKLRAKPGGDQINVVMGDFADVGVTGEYRLIYVVFNSFFNLLTQDDQVRCFENVASHLTDDGAFVVEGGCTMAFIDHLRSGQYVDAEGIAVDSVRFDLLRLDPSTQVLIENHVQVTPDGITFNPVMQRYAWPSELDLMARFAGLTLHERWGGWHRQAFTASSDNVISVYRRRGPEP